ncbi:hypothetical protein J2785_006748 [Burkholderia ambifaria]|nr:hypothetical protein [Burkholderia ambifaria]
MIDEHSGKLVTSADGTDQAYRTNKNARDGRASLGFVG